MKCTLRSDKPCGNYAADEYVAERGDCRACFLRATVEKFRLQYGYVMRSQGWPPNGWTRPVQVNGEVNIDHHGVALITPDKVCGYRGASTHEGVECPTCPNALRPEKPAKLPIYECAIHGRCTLIGTKQSTGLESCAFCLDHTARVRQEVKMLPAPVPAPASPDVSLPVGPPVAFPIRFDEQNLARGWPGLRFNPSIIHDGAHGYVLVYRNGWAESEIFAVRLDLAFQPCSKPTHLPLYHPQEATYGREDPRLFRFRGKIHCMYTGVKHRPDDTKKVERTSVLYARLDDDLKVAQIFYPHYPQRTSWEKNWAFFEHDGELYAVYSIASIHRILRIDGDRAETAYFSKNSIRWSGGEWRGGACPVRVGDEYWHFAHDRIEKNGQLVYRTLLYTFAARPPFEVLRIAPEPIVVADHGTNRDNYADVVFAGGVVLREVSQ